jgi:hypothetical protein
MKINAAPKYLLGRQPVSPQAGSGLNAGNVPYSPPAVAKGANIKGKFLRQPVPK